jgi:hypothetical protein
MTPVERETIYDKEIAPQLLALSNRCQEVGMQFVAEVEWAPGEGGTTVAINEHASLAVRLVHVAAQALGNVDSIFIWISKYATAHGHNSIFLHRLGIPTSAVSEPVTPKTRSRGETTE